VSIVSGRPIAEGCYGGVDAITRKNIVLKRLLLIVAFASGATRSFAQVGPSRLNLAEATLEELMNIPITTASRTTESLTDAPARVQVVTAVQIRQRGYRSLSDVLKDLPDFKVPVRDVQ
jgi:outer membrane receptor for ferrienterochelin and colicin